MTLILFLSSCFYDKVFICQPESTAKHIKYFLRYFTFEFIKKSKKQFNPNDLEKNSSN